MHGQNHIKLNSFLVFRYIINFLLDSSVGLGIIYIGIRMSQYLSRVKQWEAINFGEYGQCPCARTAMLLSWSLSLLWC